MMELIIGMVIGALVGSLLVITVTVNELHPEPFEPQDDWDGRRM